MDDTHDTPRPIDSEADRTTELVQEPATESSDDLQGHSATIYRRRRGPYPLRHGAPLPDADDRKPRRG